jgi:hypothetical protein
MIQDIAKLRFFIFSLGALVVGAAYYFSLIGFGLPDQEDPLSIRQESATNSRGVRGGTRTFGK